MITSPITKSITNAITKALRLIYNLDGIDDYWTIPQSSLVAGDTVGLKFIATGSIGLQTINILSSNGVGSDLRVSWRVTGSAFEINGCTATLDGIPIIDDVTPFPNDGLEHVLIATSTGSALFDTIGGFAGNGQANFPIYDVDIQAVSGNRFYPVNDGWAANPKIANTLDPSGLTDGTAFNFNEERWVEANV